MSYFGYQEDDYVNLTIEGVLLRISQEEIFSVIAGELPDVSKLYISFVRDDRIGDCYFNYYNNKLYFTDFGHSNPHMDCFSVYQEKYNLSLIQVLKFLNNHFKLGLGGGEPVQIKYKPVSKEKNTRKHTDILYRTRTFNRIVDGKFWSPYGISRDNLFEDSVLPILWYKFYSNRKKEDIIIRPLDIYPTYAYSEFSPRVKIYSPYKDKNSGKWVTNTNKNDIGNLNNLPVNGDKLVITKSYKDCRVLRNLGIVSIWFQNEGVIPDIGYVVNLCNRFAKIIVIFDNDKAGIDAGKRVVNTINSHFPMKATSVLIPLLAGVTDSSDFYKSQGKFKLIKFLSTKNLI